MSKAKEYPLVTRENLIMLLKSKNGETVKLTKLCVLFHCFLPRMASICAQLVNEGIFRQVNIGRDGIGYYHPTQRQLDAEIRIREINCQFRPLKLRPRHAEALARARAVRDAYQSIG